MLSFAYIQASWFGIQIQASWFGIQTQASWFGIQTSWFGFCSSNLIRILCSL